MNFITRFFRRRAAAREWSKLIASVNEQPTIEENEFIKIMEDRKTHELVGHVVHLTKEIKVNGKKTLKKFSIKSTIRSDGAQFTVQDGGSFFMYNSVVEFSNMACLVVYGRNGAKNNVSNCVISFRNI